MKKVQHGNSRGVVRTWRKSKMESLKQYLTALLIIVAKLSILDAYRAPSYTSGNNVT